MKYFLLAAIVLSGCAVVPWAPHPVSFANMAVICAPQRVVVCADDTTPDHCALVTRAVAEINVVVPGLMLYGGLRDWPTIANAKHAGKDWTVVADISRTLLPEMSHNTLAVTLAHPDKPMCLHFTPIALLWAPGELSPQSEYQVVLHEILHSLGAAHADTNFAWSTIMRPGLSSEYRTGLSAADRNALRAIYAQ